MSVTDNYVLRPHHSNFPRFAAAHPDVYGVTADLTRPCELGLFRDLYPERCISLGMAEQNMIGFAGGMAREGLVPYVHTFGVFTTRRVIDQIEMAVAYPNLPVKIVGFLPGVATLLGVSHQAIEDVAILRAVPNMAIFEPSGPEYHAAMVQMALDWDGPAYLRMKRPETTPPPFEPQSLEIGKGVIRREGGDLTIISAGLCVTEALDAADILSSEGIEAGVVDMASLKPIDEALIAERAGTTGAVVTAENHNIIGGLGSAVAEVLAEAGIGLPFRRVGVRDHFCEGGTSPYLMNKFGLDAPAIAEAARDVVKRKG